MKDSLYEISIDPDAVLINLHPEDTSMYTIDIPSDAKVIRLVSEDTDEDSNSSVTTKYGANQSSYDVFDVSEDAYTATEVWERVNNVNWGVTTTSNMVDDIVRTLGEHSANYVRTSEHPECYLRDGGILWYADQRDALWHAVRGPEDLVSEGVVNVESSKEYYLTLVGNRDLRRVGVFDETRANLVSFRENVLDLDTGEIRPRMLEDHLRYRLNAEPWDRDEHEDRVEEFSAKMRRLAGSSESCDRLQELCGIALSAAPHDRAIYIVGTQNRHAAMVTRLLAAAIDSEFVSYLSLKDLGRQFGPADLVGKHIALSSMQGEVFLQDVETMLRIANGDGVHADRKHGAAVDFVPATTLVFAGRKLPRVRDSLFEDASELVDFVRLSGVLDSDLLGRYAPRRYRNEFVKWALEGLQRWLQHGLTPLPLGDSLSETASVRAFFDACIAIDPESGIFTHKLMKAYMAFCKSTNLTPVHRAIVLQYIREMYGLKSQTVRDGAITGSGYCGIRLKESDAASGESSGYLEELPEDIDGICEEWDDMNPRTTDFEPMNLLGEE